MAAQPGADAPPRTWTEQQQHVRQVERQPYRQPHGSDSQKIRCDDDEHLKRPLDRPVLPRASCRQRCERRRDRSCQRNSREPFRPEPDRLAAQHACGEPALSWQADQCEPNQEQRNTAGAGNQRSDQERNENQPPTQHVAQNQPRVSAPKPLAGWHCARRRIRARSAHFGGFYSQATPAGRLQNRGTNALSRSSSRVFQFTGLRLG